MPYDTANELKLNTLLSGGTGVLTYSLYQKTFDYVSDISTYIDNAAILAAGYTYSAQLTAKGEFSSYDANTQIEGNNILIIAIDEDGVYSLPVGIHYVALESGSPV